MIDYRNIKCHASGSSWYFAPFSTWQPASHLSNKCGCRQSWNSWPEQLVSFLSCNCLATQNGISLKIGLLSRKKTNSCITCIPQGIMQHGHRIPADKFFLWMCSRDCPLSGQHRIFCGGQYPRELLSLLQIKMYIWHLSNRICSQMDPWHLLSFLGEWTLWSLTRVP